MLAHPRHPLDKVPLNAGCCCSEILQLQVANDIYHTAFQFGIPVGDDPTEISLISLAWKSLSPLPLTVLRAVCELQKKTVVQSEAKRADN